MVVVVVWCKCRSTEGATISNIGGRTEGATMVATPEVAPPARQWETTEGRTEGAAVMCKHY